MAGQSVSSVDAVDRSDRSQSNRGPFRSLRRNQRAQVRIVARDGSSDRLLLTVPYLLEAPNWTPDGASLILNGGGHLYHLDLDVPAALRKIPVEGVFDINNDHLLSPDGQTIFISAGGRIFSVPIGGGTPALLSPDDGLAWFLHGISPDGARLACTTIKTGGSAVTWGLHTLSSLGGNTQCLLSSHKPLDGPEWTVDGRWIWFNGEIQSDLPGHAHLFRMRSDGSDLRQMTAGERVDWFPHASPAGDEIVYLSFPPGTQGHPADVPVELRIMPIGGGASARIASLFGGQGTINVNSWSPDGRHLAYIAYPIGTDGEVSSDD